jgi:hypothetical protein
MADIDPDLSRLLERLALVGLVVVAVWLVELVEELRHDQPRKQRRHRRV